MPIVSPSSYHTPFGFGSGHLQSIYAGTLRKVPRITTERERIETPDGDFLDLDWGESNGEGRLAILSHGLEGNSFQPYVQGMAAALQKLGWDCLAWNFRGCSGEPNRMPHSYHSGATGDLQVLLDHVYALDRYQSVAMVGFSIGGNITLKYLGEQGAEIDPRIVGAVTFSVPCDLQSSADQMADFGQRIYMERFLKCLRNTMRQKIAMHPESVKDHGLDAMRTFHEFDEYYTAPLNGFASAADYWARCSSKPVLHNIRVPTLLVSAQDDPFLAPACYPHEAAEQNDHFFFESPQDGGHLGFVPRDRSGEYWSESRAAEFLEALQCV